jgi:hypothetical protein
LGQKKPFAVQAMSAFTPDFDRKSGRSQRVMSALPLGRTFAVQLLWAAIMSKHAEIFAFILSMGSNRSVARASPTPMGLFDGALPMRV